MKKILTILFLLVSSQCWATNYYVRDGGGTATQCTGTTNAVYPGSGSAQACAFNHPAWPIGVYQGASAIMVSGDTLNISGDSDTSPGTQAQYKIGYGMPNSSCSTAATTSCELNQVPSGTDATHLTQVIGTGTHQPQLYGVERVSYVFRADGNWIYLNNIEMTSHKYCGYQFGVNACPTSYPYGDFARDGIAAGGSNNTFENLYIHNMTRYGILAESGFGGITKYIDLHLIGDQQGGFSTLDVDFLGSIYWYRPIVKWSGCQEAYPLVNAGIANPLNYANCTAQDGTDAIGSNSIIADGIAFGSSGLNKKGNWYFYGGEISFSTQEGVDFLHGDSTGSAYFDKVRMEGNAGQAIKTGMPLVGITNSLIITDCGWWYGAAQSIAGGMKSGGSCRAAYGIALPVEGANNTFNIINNTFITNQSSMFGQTNTGVSSDVFNFYNNIFVFGYSYLDNLTLFPSGGGSNGRATFFAGTGSPTRNQDYNLWYGISAGCSGTHELCNTVDPGFAAGVFPIGTSGGAANTFYQGTSGITLVTISNTSAAKGTGNTGYTYWNTSTDVFDTARASPPSMGGVEYNSTAAAGYPCSFDAQCASGSCTNNFCSGSCKADTTACSSGLTCCNAFCISSQCSSCIANGVASGSAASCCSGIVYAGSCISCIANGNASGASADCCSGLISGGVCQQYICGDALVTSPEVCDTSGPNVNSQTCFLQGFNGGTLGCSGGCLSFDTSGCTNACLTAGLGCSTNGQCCSSICNSGQCVNAGGDITTGLVGWWKFDEGSGSTATDSSGLSNDGTEVNSPTYVTGLIGTNALSFSAVSTQGIKKDSFSTTIDNISTCAWIKTAAVSSSFIFSLNRNSSNYLNEYVMSMNSSGKVNVFDYNGSFGFNSGNSTTAVNDNSWHHVCFTKSGTSGIFYKDGLADGTTTSPSDITYGKTSFSIGYNYRDFSSYWNGSIDDVRVYNRTLSATDVAALYVYNGTCSANNSACSVGTTCCSGICTAGLCSNNSVAPVNTCRWYGKINGYIQ